MVKFLSLSPTPVECYNKPLNPNFHKIGEGLMWYNFNDNDNNYRRNNSGMIHKMNQNLNTVVVLL